MLQNIKNRHLTHAFTSAYLNDFVKKILPLVAKISNKFDFSLAYSYLYDFVKKILPLVAKISNKFDFSLAYSYLYGYAKKILSLAAINIQASLIFLARLFVSLQ